MTTNKRRMQPRVLLVEDEPAQREAVAYNLESEGFGVIHADNGEDALMLVDEDMPDIIILDWMLPRLSGIEVCRQLKMRPETRGSGLYPRMLRRPRITSSNPIQW